MSSNLQTAGAADDPDLGVSTENIMHASEVLRSASDHLFAVLNSLPVSGFESCGTDPVSSAAAAAFNEKSFALIEGFQRHVQELGHQSEALASTARSYAVSETYIRRIADSR
ncbi:PE domain-containing protein [Pseudonocardia benzenivorans]|uniref:PE domain-containing protein n=1 Tax=Pseudonocardia benzenivorans TaxID=228005 RepID=A0ABW3VSR2_9PSEU